MTLFYNEFALSMCFLKGHNVTECTLENEVRLCIFNHYQCIVLQREGNLRFVAVSLCELLFPDTHIVTSYGPSHQVHLIWHQNAIYLQIIAKKWEYKVEIY